MAGKSKLKPKKKDNRGGKRPGAGRPKREKPDYDDDFREYCGKAIAKVEKKHGETMAEAVFGMIWDSEVQDTVKVSIWNKYCDMNTVKKSESNQTITKNGPVIGLPPRYEDPMTVIDGGKAQKQ